MPISTPSSLTTNYSLKKYDDGDQPGADALNENLDTIDAGIKEALDAAEGTNLTKIIYRIKGVSGGATLNVTELFNNTGATLSGSVAESNTNIGDYTFIYTTNFLTGKKVFMNTITVWESLAVDDDPQVILGYISLNENENDRITMRSVDSALTPSNDIISTTDYLIFEFTIMDA